MQIGKSGIALIKKWEGYHTKLPDGRCQAYLDRLVRPALRSPGYDGLWTIGYGCTEGVYEGLVWSEAEAEKHLLVEVNKHVGHVNRLLDGAEVNQNQFDALVSFSYNLGPGWLQKSDHPNGLLGLIKAGEHAKASNHFGSYVRAGGKVYKGLVNRRADEKKLFNTVSTKEVVATSRRLSFTQNIRNFFATLSVGSFFTWQNFEQAKTFMSDNTGFILLGAGLTAFLGYKFIEYLSMNEYKEGRYTPSKQEEVPEAEVAEVVMPEEVLYGDEEQSGGPDHGTV
jgi:lysozyme